MVSWGELRQKKFPTHQHLFHEIVFIVAGKGVHVVDQVAFPVEAGDIYVVKSDQTHGFRKLDFELYNVQYQPAYFEQSLQSLRNLPEYNALFVAGPTLSPRSHFRLKGIYFRQILDLIKSLKNEIENQPPGMKVMRDSLFHQLVVLLCRARKDSKPVDDLSSTLGATMSFIESHYDQSLTLEQLANRVGMSVNSFLRHFKSAFDMSPMSYLVLLRVKKAGTLLRDTEKRISDIAFEVGFNDSNYFSRQFKNIVELTPRQYRDMSRRTK